MPHIYSYFEHWFGPLQHIASALFALALITLFAWRARVALLRAENVAIPEDRLSARTVGELLVGGLTDFVEGTMGHEGRKFVPFFGALFIYIFVSNLVGVIPGFNPPTSNINTNYAVAIVVFLMTHVLGIRAHGFLGYLRHFMGPVWALAPLLFLIEILSHLVRPASLSMRLYGNMMGDHTVLSIFTHLTKVGIPVIFVGLGVFVCFVQAVVFTMLSMVYIAMATEHEH